jgi:hypothetical protein
MLSAARHGDAGAAGVLILRVWVESSSGGPQLRIRMVGRQDLARNAQDTGSASTVEETLVYVRDWLERFTVSSLLDSASAFTRTKRPERLSDPKFP